MLTLEGNIVNTNKVFRGRIEIDESGTISKIGSPTGEADFVFKDELIFPGFVDLHVHAREDMSHSQDYKEDFASAGQAAVSGGVVAFAEMPNNKIPPVDDKSYEEKNNLAKKSLVQVLLYAGVGEHTRPLKKKVPYKVYMGHSVGDLFFSSLEVLEETLKNYKRENISFHCEDPKILEDSASALTHELRRPDEAEVAGIETAIKLIEKYKLTGKICHVSTVGGVERIIAAKRRGVKVVAEVAPHHLYFDETKIVEKGRTKFQVNPPIRQSKETRLALIKFLKEGEIDCLATDHAPHSVEEKEKGISGLPHLDTYGPFVAWLMQEHSFTAEEVARVCSKNPGNFLNQFVKEKYGEIAKGFTGSLTVLDLGKGIKITKNILKTKCNWSPFEGVTFPGRVAVTIIKGQVYEK